MNFFFSCFFPSWGFVFFVFYLSKNKIGLPPFYSTQRAEHSSDFRIVLFYIGASFSYN